MQTIIGMGGNTLPLEGQNQHTIVILLVQLCISFSGVQRDADSFYYIFKKSAGKRTQGQHTAF